jgi:CDP-diacylglycerol--serine O-phosphatidyltransferase
MKIPSTRVVVPNLFTLGATFCGISALWLAFEAKSADDFYLATTLIPLACFLDGLDGRVARMLNGETKFGMELDSLSDAITFGVAPGFLLYAWALKPYELGGLFVAFVFAAAAMVRLARFNVQTADPARSNRYFTGLPAPMGGMGIAAIIAFQIEVFDRSEALDRERPFLAAYAVLLAVLMVSEVPFRTFKDVRMTGQVKATIGVILAAVVVVGLWQGFMISLSLVHTVYLVTGLAAALFAGRGSADEAGIVATDTEEDDDGV